jgi:hypothetical protein
MDPTLPTSHAELHRLAKEADFYGLPQLAAACRNPRRRISDAEFITIWNTCGNNIALPRADLRGVSMAFMHLEGANFRDCDLRGVDMKECRLGTQLAGTFPGKSRKAEEGRGADLRGADLRGANLVGVHLMYAMLQGADLRGANLEGAIINRVFVDQQTDLRGARLVDLKIQDPLYTVSAKAQPRSWPARASQFFSLCDTGTPPDSLLTHHPERLDGATVAAQQKANLQQEIGRELDNLIVVDA